ncbi:MAG: hypothetical protein WCT01_00930 [Candidatus Shapirobacteria bacterium]
MAEYFRNIGKGRTLKNDDGLKTGAGEIGKGTRNLFLLDTPEHGSGTTFFRGGFREAALNGAVPIEGELVTRIMTVVWGLRDEVDPEIRRGGVEQEWINDLAQAMTGRLLEEEDGKRTEVELQAGEIGVRAFMDVTTKRRSRIEITVNKGESEQRMVLGIKRGEGEGLKYVEGECYELATPTGEKRELCRGEKVAILAWIPELLAEMGREEEKTSAQDNRGMELSGREHLEDLVVNLEDLPPDEDGGRGMAIKVTESEARGLWLGQFEGGETTLMISSTLDGRPGGFQMCFKVGKTKEKFDIREESAVKFVANRGTKPMSLVERLRLMAEVPQLVLALDAFIKNGGEKNGQG